MVDGKLFDTLLEPLFILDQEGKIVYCNEAASLIVNVGVRKILRSKVKLQELVQFADPIPALENLISLTDPSPYQEVSFQVEDKSGRVQLTVQKFNDDPSWIVFFRDVTLEETLQRKYRAELEKKEDVIRDLEKAKAQIEDYSRNLEKMVAERTAQLSQLNAKMTALLDSLDQGFLIFNEKGDVLEIVSKACEQILGRNPAGQPIWKALNYNDKETVKFQKWMATVFAEMLPFEDLAPLGPSRFAHPEGKEISLSYYPLREDSAIVGIVLVATDITNLVFAQREAEKERAYAKMILQLVKQKRQIQAFLREAETLTQTILMQAQQPKPNFEEAFRALHTLKGGSASFSILSIVQASHHAEELLKQWNEKPSEESRKAFVRQVQELPQHLNHFQEDCSVLLGNRSGDVSREISSLALSEFYEKIPADFPLKRAFFESFLAEPVGPLFEHYEDQIQQTAAALEKIVAPLQVEPAAFRLWPQPYEQLFSTFVHAFRNAIDHGIETPENRELKGKATAGRIGVQCERLTNGLLRFSIWDDGGGIDPQIIRQKLDKNSISHSHENDQQVIQHVFDSSFSTREQVTEISGRGVGMDAIKAAAEKLGGTARVESTLGKGSTVIIEVPWLTETPKSLQKAS